MRTKLTAGLALLIFSAEVGLAQSSPRGGSWQGQVEVFQFNFSYALGHRSNPNQTFVYRGVDLTKYDYKLYQNSEGLAREELTHMNRARSVEGPLDIRLLNYKQGYGFVFDKAGGEAIKGSLSPPVSGTSLGEMRILGFSCKGEEYRWPITQGGTVRLESWSAKDSDFKVPLLQVEYSSDRTGASLGMWVRIVDHLEQVPELPASLFEPPSNLHVLNVPLVE